MTQTTLPITPGQKLQLKNSPAEIVEFTGKVIPVGKNTFVEVMYPNGVKRKMLFDMVLPLDENSQDPLEQIARGCFGRIDDLKRLLTFEKLKGTLHEIIYSMEAAQVDFYPYQFKPVLKFIRSPTQRLILADEVGLGKTIESGLIWIEMQARRQARRLLVICPPTLMDKWENELKDKFLVDALQVDFAGFKKKVDAFMINGPGEEFALISSYAALRPSKDTLDSLRHPNRDDTDLPPKARLLKKLKYWEEQDNFPFDLVIFDEAHYMRNSGTASHMLGEALSGAAQGVLCVSATPVNNKSEDLHSLLTLVDAGFFSSQASFGELVYKNKPAVQAATCLARDPIDYERLNGCLAGMERSDYVRDSPLFDKLKQNVANMQALGKPSYEMVSRTTDLAEKLNILGTYINRTRRRQVEVNRPVRRPHICTIRLTETERRFYDAIDQHIRNLCQRSTSEFSTLALISRQLMAASSLPAYAQSLLGKQDENISLFEIFGIEDSDERQEKSINLLPVEDFSSYAIPCPKKLAACDSKFARLRKIIQNFNGERIIIFAYYHATLLYLLTRLRGIGLKVGMISGRSSMEERITEIQRFTSGEIQIILSSEVGSEGIDLQCSHIVVNYDMPWNPMRVEQRIGRIDRVGQQSPILHIINFNIDNTIEQRVYDRLYQKLGQFGDTLGDMEEILGREIRQLTIDLFSSRLTPEEENERIEQTARALFNRMEQMNKLEEQSSELIGLSDYIQRKIEEDHGLGRYIRPEEMEDYVQDFFGRHFLGTLIQRDVPVPGCLHLRLSAEARDDLNRFMARDQSLMARSLRPDPLTITFDRAVMKNLPLHQKRRIAFVNHLSPLIRWITSYYKDHGHNLCRTSALMTTIPSLEEGIYVFSVQLWEIKGLIPYQKLSYGIKNIETGENLSQHEAENVYTTLLASGKDWIYRNEIPEDFLRDNLKDLDEKMEQDFYEEVEFMQAENETMYNIRSERIKNIFLPRIEQHKEILKKLEEEGKHKTIPARKGQLRKTEDNMKRQMAELDKRAVFEPQCGNIAMGLFYNNPLSE